MGDCKYFIIILLFFIQSVACFVVVDLQNSLFFEIRRQKCWKPLSALVPSEISATDKVQYLTIDNSGPNVDIISLTGANELGALIWGYNIYLFITLFRQTDIFIVLLAKMTGGENRQWYLDFKDGYKYDVPAPFDLLRIGLTICLGYFVNKVLIGAFDGDSFWGWSTAVCIAIPSSLISLSVEKLKTREEGVFEAGIIYSFLSSPNVKSSTG